MNELYGSMEHMECLGIAEQLSNNSCNLVAKELVSR
jgi:hypothetical protein